MADWCNLPYDIIHKISTYLVVIEDFLAFSAVCCSWRSVYLAKQWHPGPQVPWIMFCSFEMGSFTSFVNLSRNKVHNSKLPEVRGRRCLGSSTEWLVTIGHDLTINLFNPFTRVSVSLPPVSSLQIDETVNWYDLIRRAYVFRKPCTSNANEKDLVVMIIYGPSKTLAFCRPGYSSWNCVKDESHNAFLDVVCVKDQIYALCDLASLAVIDIDTDTITVTDILTTMYRSLRDWEQVFLVESSGDLWIVFRILPDEHYVFSFDFNKKHWIRLSNLGNHSIFLDDNCSVSVLAPDCLNCKSNSIYYASRWLSRDKVDMYVYSLTTGICNLLLDIPEGSFLRLVLPVLY